MLKPVSTVNTCTLTGSRGRAQGDGDERDEMRITDSERKKLMLNEKQRKCGSEEEKEAREK